MTTKPENLSNQAEKLLKEKKYEDASKCYQQAEDLPGQGRIADTLMYQERKPLQALQYYKKAHRSDKVAEIQSRMTGAIASWLGIAALKSESAVQLYSQIAKIIEKSPAVKKRITHNVTERKTYTVDRRLRAYAKVLTKQSHKF